MQSALRKPSTKICRYEKGDESIAAALALPDQSTNIDRQHSQTLIAGSTWQSIWHMSWPMVLNMSVLSLANFCEGWIAGHLGADALSALGIASQIWFFAMLLTLALSAGTISVLSRCYGAGDHQATIESGRQALLLAVLFGASISVITLISAQPLLAMLGASPAVLAQGWRYLQFTGAAAMPYTVLWISNSIFRAAGNARTPLITQLVVCASMVALDLLFCLEPCNLGLAGIGMSWLISSLLGITINAFAMKRSNLARCLAFNSWRSVRISAHWMRQFLSIGLPASMQDISLVLGSLGLFMLIGKCAHPVASQAAWAAGWRLEETLTIMPMYGLNIAASSIVGQNVGANKPARAKACGWQIALIAALINVVIATLLFTFRAQIAATMTNEAIVTVNTINYLQAVAWTEPFFACWLVLSGCMQGAGYTRAPMAVTIICFNAVRLAMSWYLLGQGCGATGIWFSMAATTVLAGLWLIVIWQREGWCRQAHRS